MQASELAWAQRQLQEGSALVSNSNHRGANSFIKYIRVVTTELNGEPFQGSVGLPADPVTARFFAPAGPSGPAGHFTEPFDFDWRIYVGRLPSQLQTYLFPTSQSQVCDYVLLSVSLRCECFTAL